MSSSSAALGARAPLGENPDFWAETPHYVSSMRLPETPVVVVERAASLTAFDPERAFLYLIDGRGQKFTDAHHLTDKVE